MIVDRGWFWTARDWMDEGSRWHWRAQGESSDGPGPFGWWGLLNDRHNSVEHDGEHYFAKRTIGSGVELWRTVDGSGPELVTDIYPGRGSSFPSRFHSFGDELYFVANDGQHGAELWHLGPSGAAMVADINPGLAASRPMDFVEAGGALYFTAFSQEFGRELWTVNDTGVASRVTDINAGSASARPTQLTEHNDTLYFAANDGTDRKLFATVTAGPPTPVLFEGSELIAPRIIAEFRDDLVVSARLSEGDLLERRAIYVIGESGDVSKLDRGSFAGLGFELMQGRGAFHGLFDGYAQPVAEAVAADTFTFREGIEAEGRVVGSELNDATSHEAAAVTPSFDCGAVGESGSPPDLLNQITEWGHYFWDF